MKNASMGLPIRLGKIVSDNFNVLGLYITLFALLLIDFKSIRGLILFIFLYCTFCIIFTKIPTLLLNPTYSIFGYKIYRVEEDVYAKDGKKVRIPRNSALISKNNLFSDNQVRYTKIIDQVYFCF